MIEPVSVPMNCDDVTEVNPARVVELDPSEIAVVPTVTCELTSAVLGMLVRPAPEPVNWVAVTLPWSVPP